MTTCLATKQNTTSKRAVVVEPKFRGSTRSPTRRLAWFPMQPSVNGAGTRPLPSEVCRKDPCNGQLPLVPMGAPTPLYGGNDRGSQKFHMWILRVVKQDLHNCPWYNWMHPTGRRNRFQVPCHVFLFAQGMDILQGAGFQAGLLESDQRQQKWVSCNVDGSPQQPEHEPKFSYVLLGSQSSFDHFPAKGPLWAMLVGKGNPRLSKNERPHPAINVDGSTWLHGVVATRPATFILPRLTTWNPRGNSFWGSGTPPFAFYVNL